VTYTISIEDAKAQFPDYEFVKALTPSAQKCAFHVRDLEGNDLCLKIISPDYELGMLEREILALQTLAHDGIARLVEFTLSTRGGVSRRFILEEFVDGHDLTEDLSHAPWTLGRLAEVFVQICNALGAMRESNIVHRDLKPSNIRVDTCGRPRIIDFGLARHLDLPDMTRTEDGAQKGTPIYFAPEQFEGTKYDIDHRADLWAIGVLMFQAMCGCHPFYKSGMSLAELRCAVCECANHFGIPEFTGLSHAVQVLLRKLLAKQREQRPSDARYVAKILQRIGAEK